MVTGQCAFEKTWAHLLLLGCTELEELLNHVITENINHEIVAEREYFAKDCRLVNITSLF